MDIRSSAVFLEQKSRELNDSVACLNFIIKFWILNMDNDHKSIQDRITVVTVTYGYRQDMLEQMIESCIANKIRSFVVVNNGATWNVGILRQRFQTCVFDIVDMQGNKGPAAGYSAGIRRALESDYCVNLWLLDDDLAPESDCLKNLLKEYAALIQINPKESIAVLAARTEFLKTLYSGNYLRLMNPRKNTFLEFSVADIWPKLKKRLPWPWKNPAQEVIPDTFSIQVAPYGGLFLHRSIVENIGFPDSDFFLYVDDYEYTYRITQSGGKILLIPSACLRDLEQCWNSSETYYSSLHAWLAGPDFRAYYTARNMTHFELHLRDAGNFSYYINKYIYLGLLYAMALLRKRTARMNLLHEAVKAGASRHLGMDIRFPLP